MILKLYGKEGKQVMVEFNGMPQSYAEYSFSDIPLVNSVYGSVRLLEVAGGRPKYRVEYEDDRFKKYSFATSSRKDAMNYMFSIQNMHPFHSIVYNRHSDFKNYRKLPKEFVDFMDMLTFWYPPLSVIVIPMLGRKEAYGVWEGSPNIHKENGGEYVKESVRLDLSDALNHLGYYMGSTGGRPALIEIPWYMGGVSKDIASYADTIPVVVTKYYSIENKDYTGTVMWTDGMSFFRENIREYSNDCFEYEQNEVVKELRNIYRGRKVHVYKRSHAGVMDKFFPKGYTSRWTGYNLDLVKMIGNDRLYK